MTAHYDSKDTIAMLDYFPFGAMEIDNGEIVYLNRYLREKFGLTLKSSASFCKRHDELHSILLRTSAESRKRHVEINGETYYIDCHFMPQARKVILFLPLAYLTLQESEFSALKEAYEDFREIFRNSFDGIYVTDGKGKTLWFNEACERNYGLSARELMAENVVAIEEQGLIKPVIAPKVIATKKKITAMQESRSGKKIMVTGIPVFDRDGNVKKVIINSRDTTELVQLQEELAKAQERLHHYESELNQLRRETLKVDGIVLNSPCMKDIVNLVLRVAKVDTTVLITGESGVGKEIIARLIHRESPRAAGPFIKINCGAIPRELLESELFGYESGAFTGALKQGKVGILELANSGTLFLDEISELPLDLQVKLLQVLQDKTLTRLGGTRSVTVDLRIIAATNRSLSEMVKQKLFRADLYYRLNVVPVMVPPLRDRKEDIIPLIHTFLDEFNLRYDFKKRFSGEALELMLKYPWPGNVRELRNMVERMVVTSSQSPIGAVSFPEPLVDLQIDGQDNLDFKTKISLFEEKVIRDALKRYGSTRAVARVLNVSQSTVVRKLKSNLEKGGDSETVNT